MTTTTATFFVRIFNDSTLEIIEFYRVGRSATTIERNAVRWAYRNEFIQKGDRYHVELRDIPSKYDYAQVTEN